MILKMKNEGLKHGVVTCVHGGMLCKGLLLIVVLLNLTETEVGEPDLRNVAFLGP